MQTQPTIILTLPDGTSREFTPNDPAIQLFKVPHDRYPGFEIDGDRYVVGGASELAYYPPSGGRAVILLLALAEPLVN